MPWYYAGPDTKPVGPISLEELHGRRAAGVIMPDTYVIEATGNPAEPGVWKHYRELFPLQPVLPPVPALPPAPPIPAPAVRLPVADAPHPLFPSAAPIPGQGSVFHPSTRPDPYYDTRSKSNPWCVWGFGLGLVGFFFSFLCGAGIFLALPSVLLCVIGLAQVQRNREQSGRGLAAAGLALSLVALVIALCFVLAFVFRVAKTGKLTVTEQTYNDSN